MENLSSEISGMKKGTGLILSLFQYKQDVITEQAIPRDAGIQCFDLSEDKVCSLRTCKFSS